MSVKTRPATAAETATRKRPKLASVPGSAHENDDATFDRLVYERVRLGIMSALAVREELTFSELKALFDVSDGNLSAQARGSKIPDLHQVLRGPAPEVGLSAHPARA